MVIADITRKINTPLYKNSLYLMLSTAMMSGLGFLFWIVSTKLFSANDIGLSTTLISTVTLISSFSLLGLGSAIIKYLPNTDNKNVLITTTMSVVSIISIFLSVVFLIFVKLFSPELTFLKDNYYYQLFFIVTTTFAAISFILDNVFISYRAAQNVFIKNTIFSATKLILPFVLLTYGFFGLFLSFGIGIIVAVFYSLFVLFKYFDYRVTEFFHIKSLNSLLHFSIANYFSGFLASLPAQIAPLMITHTIGPTFSAYFYMDLMIANLIYLIPNAIAQSFFAEGSNDHTTISTNLAKITKLCLLIMVPLIIGVVLFGNFVLNIFGTEYALQGFNLLRIFAVSGIFVTVSTIGETLLKLKHKLKELVIIYTIGTTTTLVLMFYFSNDGLNGIGLSWLLGTALTGFLFALSSLK